MEKDFHDNYKKYVDFIINHKNFEGIPYKVKNDGQPFWVAPKTTLIGKNRIEWAKKIANKSNIKTDKPGWLAKVMYEIHPNKIKICQICGKGMSVSYIYLNENFIDKAILDFNFKEGELNTLTSLYDFVGLLHNKGKEYSEIKQYLINRFNLLKSNKYDKDIENKFPNFKTLIINNDINYLISIIEYLSRSGYSRHVGPGCMSNFPDRLDGFHSYNRCCRELEDNGRKKSNMKTYNKDRRAYENWSDGNIYAANKFMNSGFFDGESADHIGPISLGFKHESIFLQKMAGGKNSTKRDRITNEDIELLISIEKKFNLSSISWFSEKIWDFIKVNYKILYIDSIRKILKINLHNYLTILYKIKSEGGEDFLKEILLKDKLPYFDFEYEFNIEGEIIKKEIKNKTDNYIKEIDRFYRVSLESLDDYNDKSNSNRKLKPSFKEEHLSLIKDITDENNKKNYVSSFQLLKSLMEQIQISLINDFEFKK